jgi:hypothetical protein
MHSLRAGRGGIKKYGTVAGGVTREGEAFEAGLTFRRSGLTSGKARRHSLFGCIDFLEDPPRDVVVRNPPVPGAAVPQALVALGREHAPPELGEQTRQVVATAGTTDIAQPAYARGQGAP